MKKLRFLFAAILLLFTTFTFAAGGFDDSNGYSNWQPALTALYQLDNEGEAALNDVMSLTPEYSVTNNVSRDLNTFPNHLLKPNSYHNYLDIASVYERRHSKRYDVTVCATAGGAGLTKTSCGVDQAVAGYIIRSS